MRISDWSSDVCSSYLGKSRASRTNCLNQLLRLGQGETTYQVDLLRDHYFAGLKIGNHSQKPGATGAGTRGLLSIDRREIVACGLCFASDAVLCTQILPYSSTAPDTPDNPWGRGR